MLEVGCRAARNVGFLFRARCSSTPTHRLLSYKAQIRPTLEYCYRLPLFFFAIGFSERPSGWSKICPWSSSSGYLHKAEEQLDYLRPRVIILVFVFQNPLRQVLLTFSGGRSIYQFFTPQRSNSLISIPLHSPDCKDVKHSSLYQFSFCLYSKARDHGVNYLHWKSPGVTENATDYGVSESTTALQKNYGPAMFNCWSLRK